MELLQKYQGKTKELSWPDLLILTFVLWAFGIAGSTISYIRLLQGSASIEENLTFSSRDNYQMLAIQAGCLLVALLYLRLRQFDFSTWKISFHIRAFAAGVLIFLGGALLVDLFHIVTSPLQAVLPFPHPIGAFFGNETVSKIIYAAFNGVYEELYFLGICLAVPPKRLKWAVPFSMLVRFSFHTYQGMLSAISIGFLFGGFAYLLYRRSKSKNLLPFFLAHALADVFGIGILYYILR